MRPRVLNLEPDNYSQQARDILQSFGRLEDYTDDQDSLPATIGRYDIVIVRLGYILDAQLLSEAGRLKAIATPTTGLNHIDIEYAGKNGIKIIALKGERQFLDGIYATAELAWGLLLALLRNIPAACSHVHEYGWDRDMFIGAELHGKTLGVIGFGRLGTKVAKYGQAFGMEVLAYDPLVSALPEGIQKVEKDELLARSDVISIHVPHNEATVDLISAADFARMKSTCCLVNTSRGQIVNEAALHAALNAGKIAGCALDVLAGEFVGKSNWRKDNPLVEYAKRHNNLIVTPHIGGATHDSMRKTEVFIAQKLREFWFTHIKSTGGNVLG